MSTDLADHQGAWGGRGPINPGHISALLGMLWLAAPISALLGDDHASAPRKAGALVLAGAFVAIILFVLFWPEEQPDRQRTSREIARVVVPLAIIDVTLALWDRPEWVPTMSIYVIAFVAMPTPGLRGVALCLAGVGLSVLLMIAAGWDSSDVETNALTLASISVTLLAIGNIVRANHQLRAARAELADMAVEQERNRFARDVHDLLGHSLSLIAIKARLAQKLAVDDPEAAAREAADIEQAARTSLSEVREAVSGYRGATFATELAGARRALDSAGVRMDAQVTRVSLAPEDEAVLAWALREATTNVVRHADAREVRVRLESDGAGARLLVADDGRASAGTSAGNGLRGLAERVAARAGTLESGPAPDGGFRVAVTLPAT